MITTQHSLVERLKTKPINADWERFYLLYEKPILAVAASCSLADADCRDVLQETMAKMFQRGFARYDPARGRFTPFLFGIAKDCAIDALRRRARRELVGCSLAPDHSTIRAEHAAWGPTPRDVAELAGEAALLVTALDYLLQKGAFAPKTVAIFKAVAFEQRHPSEVAEAFATSRGNIDQAKSAVLKKLRRMYAALEQGMDLEQAFVCATKQKG